MLLEVDVLLLLFVLVFVLVDVLLLLFVLVDVLVLLLLLVFVLVDPVHFKDKCLVYLLGEQSEIQTVND